MQTVLACLLLMAGYWLCLQIGFRHWYVGVGVLFATFWARPRGDWPWLAAAVAGAYLFDAAGAAGGIGPRLPSAVLEPLPALAGALLARRSALDGTIRPARILDLLLAAALTALLVVPKDQVGVWHLGGDDVRHTGIIEIRTVTLPALIHYGITHFMGAYLGIILVMPGVLWFAGTMNRAGTARILHAGLVWLLPAALLLSVPMALLAGQGVDGYLRRCLLVLVVVFSFRHGWRGAALSMLLVSTLIGIDDHLHGSADDPVVLQLVMAVMAAMALLFGASIDELRSSEAALKADKAKLQETLSALAESSRRNMELEEFERKRIAHELHDELGQLLTALELRLAGGIGNPDVASLQLLGQRMRQSLGSVVNALSPNELNQIGLYEALVYGSPSQLCELAGVRYQVELQGNGLLLNELQPATALAVYRIVQEAVNNAVKHARCRRIGVRLRIGRRGGAQRGIVLALDIRDDGIGLDEDTIRAGFHSIRDRALALGGAVRIASPGGLRVHALLRQ
ncbi:MAG: histidine kinase [Arenimonas sp.]